MKWPQSRVSGNSVPVKGRSHWYSEIFCKTYVNVDDRVICRSVPNLNLNWKKRRCDLNYFLISVCVCVCELVIIHPHQCTFHTRKPFTFRVRRSVILRGWWKRSGRTATVLLCWSGKPCELIAGRSHWNVAHTNFLLDTKHNPSPGNDIAIIKRSLKAEVQAKLSSFTSKPRSSTTRFKLQINNNALNKILHLAHLRHNFFFGGRGG